MDNLSYVDADAETLFVVGRRFLKGDGLEKDLNRARLLLTQAANAGHPLASQYLSQIDTQEGDATLAITDTSSSLLDKTEQIKQLIIEIKDHQKLISEKILKIESLLK